jgi:hypothetical protein
VSMVVLYVNKSAKTVCLTRVIWCAHRGGAVTPARLANGHICAAPEGRSGHKSLLPCVDIGMCALHKVAMM